MNLNPIKVGDLPLASYVSYTQDISAYIGNVLNDVTYRAPNDMLNTSVSAILSSMSKTIIDILRAFGGSVVPLDGSGQPTQTIYVVKFQYDNGTLISEQQIVAGQSAVAPAVEERSGYRFTGWSVDFTNIQQDIIVIAEYAQIPQYTVTFYDYDMRVLKQDTVEEGQDATPPENPERTGYQFTSWNGSYQNVAADSSVSASYNPRPYIVSFDSHGGSDVDAIPVTYDSPYGQLPSTSYDGYSFDNWYLSDDFSESSKVLSSTIVATPRNHILYAHWTELQKYAVRFEDYNGTTLSTGIVIAHQDAVPPPIDELSRTGYHFTGWTPSCQDITSNVTITATYSPNQYTVNFISYGGVVIGENPINVTYDSAYGPLLSPLGREFYTFDGWYLNDQLILSSTIVKTADDHTLSARWTELEMYTVTFIDSLNGNVINQQQVYEGYYAIEPQYEQHEQYDFIGWSVDFTNVHEDIIVSAMFEPSQQNNLHTVRFLSKDGNELMSIEVENGQSVSEDDVPEQPTETGYTFNSWSESWMNVTADIDICALYTANTYTVTCDCSYDTGVEELVDPMTGRNLGRSYSLTVTYDQPYGNLPSCILSSDDIVFTNWRITNQLTNNIVLNDSIVKTARDHILQPITSPVEEVFTVRFIDWNGYIVNTQQVVKNAAAAEPPHPDSKYGYSFDRWSSSFNFITSDTEISAVYAPNVCVVSFDPNGGTMAAGNNYKLSVTYGQQYGVLPEIDHPEYVFYGWYFGNNIILSSTYVSWPGNHILCAHWAVDMTDEEYNRMMRQLRENLDVLSNQESSTISDEYDDENNVYNGESTDISGEVLSVENNDYDESQLSNVSLDDWLRALVG